MTSLEIIFLKRSVINKELNRWNVFLAYGSTLTGYYDWDFAHCSLKINNVIYESLYPLGVQKTDINNDLEYKDDDYYIVHKLNLSKIEISKIIKKCESMIGTSYADLDRSGCGRLIPKFLRKKDEGLLCSEFIVKVFKECEINDFKNFDTHENVLITDIYNVINKEK
jgi:hypothetical protein